MVVTLKTSLPTEEELNVQEVNLSSPVLRAGAFHLGKYCEQQNNVNISYFTHFKNSKLHGSMCIINDTIARCLFRNSFCAKPN